MENVILNTVKGFFSDEIVHQLSNSTGESSDHVKKGLDAIIPTVLLSLQGQGQSGLSGILEKVKNLINFDNLDIGAFAKAANQSNEESANTNLLSSIFGEGLSSIVNSLSSFLGIKGDSITKLLSTSLPAIFSSLTNKGTNWDASSISSLLTSNKDSFLSALPTGLGLASLGLGGVGKDVHSILDNATKTISKVASEIPSTKQVTQHIEKEKKGGGLWWLLIPLLLIAAWLLFGKGCNGTDKTLNDTTAHISTVDSAHPDNVSLKLPNGQEISAWAGGIEDQLIQFVQAGDYKNLSEDQLKDKWFDFDNLNFETGTATILPESRSQLANIAAILKAFPEVKLKIGGYTDKTGDESINKKISNARAEAVAKYLTDEGLGSQVAGAEGYGSAFAKYEASAPEADRIKDRRVSVSIRK